MPEWETPELEQLLSVWNALEPRRRIVAIGAAVAVFVAILGIARLATTPGMALLYGGLEGARAGEVVQVLDQRGLRYEVRGDAIYVEVGARDEIRMALAAQGLPANASTGYELLDGLSGFGTTSQMFDAAYWRAKEGELARTIVASPHIRAARVHISQGATQPFRRESQASASVTVTPAGAGLTPVQAQALRFLVASAVAGLAPEDVAVIDSNGGLVVGETPGISGRAGDHAGELRRNVERLLEAHVGHGRAVVEVNVETVTDRETIVERRIEPETRVVVSQDSEERNATSSDSPVSGVSVASNLPDGDAAGGDARSESRETQSRQRLAYEVSQTQREIERTPGAIRRITVAVMVDGVRGMGPDGGLTWVERPANELEALRELVSAAVGLDPARGDVVTLRSLPFEPVTAQLGTAASAGWAERLGLDLMTLIQLAVLAMVVVVLALFVLRPLLGRAPGARAPAEAVPGLPPLMAGLPMPVLSGEIDDAWRADTATGMGESLGAFSSPFGGDGLDAGEAPADPVERMRQLIAERKEETIEILRNWMEEHEESR